MAANKSVIIYHHNTNEEYKKVIDSIVDQLDKHGRAVTSNSKVSRCFANIIRTPVQKEQIYFSASHHNTNRKSLIVLPPNIKIVRKGKFKIEFLENSF